MTSNQARCWYLYCIKQITLNRYKSRCEKAQVPKICSTPKMENTLYLPLIKLVTLLTWTHLITIIFLFIDIMSTDTELKLWWTEEARSMFVYYLTGSLAIAFAATVMVTKSLQRQEVFTHLPLGKKKAKSTLYINKTSLLIVWWITGTDYFIYFVFFILLIFLFWTDSEVTKIQGSVIDEITL